MNELDLFTCNLFTENTLRDSEIIRKIFYWNRHTLRALHVSYDFRVLASVVNLGLNVFKKVKSLDMKWLQVETVEEEKVFEVFLE